MYKGVSVERIEIIMTLILTPRHPADAVQMGGKAAALAELNDAGFCIPPWFVVTPTAFERSLGDGQQAQFPGPIDLISLKRIVATIHPSAAARADIDAAVRDLAPNGELLAVRSSAVDEDGVGHSFAGQLESYLFVPADRFPERVAEVWRSGFTDRVVALSARAWNASHAGGAGGACAADDRRRTSGVAFAADPITGSRSTVVISAVFGLGTALVGGDADATPTGWTTQAAC